MSDAPFSHVLAVADIGPGGRSVRLVADEAQCEAVARDLALAAVVELDAALHVTASRDRVVRVKGALAAKVRQTCVVTLDPVTNEVAEEIDVTLVPAGVGDAALPPGDIGAEGDPPDVYSGGAIDLGAIVTEFLALGIDPYPKAPGAEFSPHIESEEPDEDGPFSVLKGLGRGEGH